MHMMSKLAVAVGFLYVLMGATLAVSADWFLSVVDWESRQGLYVSAGIRGVVGLVLLVAAPTSRFPRVFRVIGVIALAAGLLMPFLPIEFWGEVIRWWTVDHLMLFRTLLAVAATLAGSFIVYAFATKSAPS
jgi:hypothetical protein